MDFIITVAEISGAVLLIAVLAAAVYLHCREQYNAPPDAEDPDAEKTEPKSSTENRKDQ